MPEIEELPPKAASPSTAGKSAASGLPPSPKPRMPAARPPSRSGAAALDAVEEVVDVHVGDELFSLEHLDLAEVPESVIDLVRLRGCRLSLARFRWGVCERIRRGASGRQSFAAAAAGKAQEELTESEVWADRAISAMRHLLEAAGPRGPITPELTAAKAEAVRAASAKVKAVTMLHASQAALRNANAGLARAREDESRAAASKGSARMRRDRDEEYVRAVIDAASTERSAVRSEAIASAASARARARETEYMALDVEEESARARVDATRAQAAATADDLMEWADAEAAQIEGYSAEVQLRHRLLGASRKAHAVAVAVVRGCKAAMAAAEDARTAVAHAATKVHASSVSAAEQALLLKQHALEDAEVTLASSLAALQARARAGALADDPRDQLVLGSIVRQGFTLLDVDYLAETATDAYSRLTEAKVRLRLIAAEVDKATAGLGRASALHDAAEKVESRARAVDAEYRLLESSLCADGDAAAAASQASPVVLLERGLAHAARARSAAVSAAEVVVKLHQAALSTQAVIVSELEGHLKVATWAVQNAKRVDAMPQPPPPPTPAAAALAAPGPVRAATLVRRPSRSKSMLLKREGARVGLADFLAGEELSETRLRVKLISDDCSARLRGAEQLLDVLRQRGHVEQLRTELNDAIVVVDRSRALLVESQAAAATVTAAHATTRAEARAAYAQYGEAASDVASREEESRITVTEMDAFASQSESDAAGLVSDTRAHGQAMLAAAHEDLAARAAVAAAAAERMRAAQTEEATKLADAAESRRDAKEMLEVAALYFRRAKSDAPAPPFLLEHLKQLMTWPAAEPPHPQRLAEAIGWQNLALRVARLSGAGGVGASFRVGGSSALGQLAAAAAGGSSVFAPLQSLPTSGHGTIPRALATVGGVAGSFRLSAYGGRGNLGAAAGAGSGLFSQAEEEDEGGAGGGRGGGTSARGASFVLPNAARRGSFTITGSRFGDLSQPPDARTPSGPGDASGGRQSFTGISEDDDGSSSAPSLPAALPTRRLIGGSKAVLLQPTVESDATADDDGQGGAEPAWYELLRPTIPGASAICDAAEASQVAEATAAKAARLQRASVAKAARKEAQHMAYMAAQAEALASMPGAAPGAAAAAAKAKQAAIVARDTARSTAAALPKDDADDAIEELQAKGVNLALARASSTSLTAGRQSAGVDIQNRLSQLRVTVKLEKIDAARVEEENAKKMKRQLSTKGSTLGSLKPGSFAVLQRKLSMTASKLGQRIDS